MDNWNCHNQTEEQYEFTVVIKNAVELQILKILYLVTTCLCLMMLCWMGVFPGGWIFAYNLYPSHQEYVSEYIETYQAYPISTISKYKDYHSILFLHHLPSFLWCLLIPIQLYPTIRQHYRNAHRTLGYVVVASASMLLMGVGVILWRGLEYDSYDYSRELPMQTSISSLIPSRYPVAAICLWSLSTIVLAIHFARSKDFQRHQYYMIRHIGSTSWIAIHRILLHTFFSNRKPSMTEVQRRDAFGDCVVYALVICVPVAEFAIYLLKVVERGRRSSHQKAI